MTNDPLLKVTVTADALFQVLTALQGPGYLIRELQVIARLPGDNPLSTLAKEYNDAVIAHKKKVSGETSGGPSPMDIPAEGNIGASETPDEA